MQHVSNGFNAFKVNNSIREQMLIIEEVWKNSHNHSNINVQF
jgi:hypothetical protein